MTKRMIATHGFLKLNRARELILDDDYKDVNEGIVYIITSSVVHVFSPSRHTYYFDNTTPVPRELTGLITDTPQTTPRSIGAIIEELCRLVIEGSIQLSHIFLDVVGHEVIEIVVNIYDEAAEHFVRRHCSYVIINSDGHFIMPEGYDGMCFRIDDDTDIMTIYDTVTHDPMLMTSLVRFQPPTVPIKPTKIYSDISIVMDG
jgi:hypothetical protein